MRVGLNLSVPNYRNNINFGNNEKMTPEREARNAGWAALVKENKGMVPALIALREQLGINVGEPITGNTMGQEISALLDRLYPLK